MLNGDAICASSSHADAEATHLIHLEEIAIRDAIAVSIVIERHELPDDPKYQV